MADSFAGMFSTPEQVLAAERQARAAQDPRAALGAKYQELGRTMGGGIGGLFGVEQVESEAVRLARTRSEAMQGVDFGSREGMLGAVKRLSDVGDYAGAKQLMTSIPAAAKGFKLAEGEAQFDAAGNVIAQVDPKADKPAEVKWSFKELKTGTAENPIYENWATKDGQLDHLVSTGDRSKAKGDTLNFGDRESVKNAYQAWGKQNELAQISQSTLDNVAYITSTLGDMETGGLTELKVGAGKLAASFGVKLDDMGDLEGAKAVMGNFVMDKLQGFTGAISEGERAYSKTIVPQLVNTVEGRKELMSMMGKMANRQIERRDMMMKYMQRKGGANLLPVGEMAFETEWKNYIKANPLFPQDEVERLDTTSMSDDDLMKSLGL